MVVHLDEDNVRLLSEAEEIEIETVPSGAQTHRATIWVVVVDSKVYVRSANGEQGHWYQELTANPVGAVYADGRRIAVRAVPVSDSTIHSQVSEAYKRKYAEYPQDVAWLLRPDVLPTTLRLESPEVNQ